MDFGAEMDQASYSTTIGGQLQDEVVVLFTTATTYGMHLILSAAAVIALVSRGLKPLPSKMLLGAVLLTTALATVYWMLKFFQTYTTITYSLVKNTELELLDRYIFALTEELRFFVPTHWIASQSGLLYLIGDCVILWRAWVIWKCWNYTQLWLAIPSVLLFASFVLSVASSVMITLLHGSDGVKYMSMFAQHYEPTWIAANGCNIASNVACTALIGYQAYKLRGYLKNSGQRRSRSARILLYLTESGVFLCIMQMSHMALNWSTGLAVDKARHANNVWAIITLFISTTYPAMVVLLVAFNRSLEDDVIISTAQGKHKKPVIDMNGHEKPQADAVSLGTHISFAPRRTETEASVTGSTGPTAKESHTVATAGGFV